MPDRTLVTPRPAAGAQVAALLAAALAFGAVAPQGALAQALTLRHQPLGEQRLAWMMMLEEIAAIERHGALERFGRVLVEQPLELRHIRDHGAGRQSYAATVRCHQCRAVRLELAAQHQKSLAQAVARRDFGAVAPEQTGELLPVVRTPGMQREIGQEQRNLASGQGNGRAGRRA
jgi:hypothetical protein